MPPYARERWTRADLEFLVQSRAVEDQHLEFKAIAAIEDRTEMSRDVSAMANADGGTIVYGIEEAESHAATLIGGDGRSVNRDALFQVLNSRIQPPIEGLRITEISLSDEAHASAFVFDIPKAVTRAPHQAHDNRYYRRFGTQVLRLDHSSVMDLFRRADAPELRVWLQEGDVANLPEEFGKHSDYCVAPAELLIENTSPAICMFAIIDIMIDGRLAFWGVPEEWDRHGFRSTDHMQFEGNHYNVFFNTFQRKWNANSPALMPLFQKSQFLLAAKTCGIGFQPSFANVPHFITWRCRAPGMNERRGRIALWLCDTGLKIVDFPWDTIDDRSM